MSVLSYSEDKGDACKNRFLLTQLSGLRGKDLVQSRFGLCEIIDTLSTNDLHSKDG